MICIKVRMLTGRYHATPWGRNANEGVPEWPPSIFRLSRALYDVWKRKFPDVDRAAMERILSTLASERPEYWLPPATSSHLRVYMHENSMTKPWSRQKIFDPFIVLAPQDELCIVWRSSSLKEDEPILDSMLRSINYLGRSETWCEMRLGKWDRAANCRPESNSTTSDGSVRIRVAGLLPPSDFIPVTGAKKGRLSWIDSLALSSKDLEKMGLDAPPSLQFHDYLLEPEYLRKRSIPKSPPSEVREVIYQMEAKMMVPVGQGVKLAERVRSKLMGTHARIIGDPTKVSPKFSGKDPDGAPLQGHVHCYICPLDRNADGFIDHLSVRCGEPFTKEELIALNRLERLTWAGGQEVLFTPIRSEEGTDQRARTMVSATPYVSPRHYRKGRGDFMEWLVSEVRRDLSEAGMPQPRGIEPLSSLRTSRGEVQWFEFVRSRKNEMPRYGYGFRLEFDEPVPGMLSVGYGAHFGLGLFLPHEP